MARQPSSRSERRYRNVWVFFRQLVSGGYPDNDATMAMAQRSVGGCGHRDDPTYNGQWCESCAPGRSDPRG